MKRLFLVIFIIKGYNLGPVLCITAVAAIKPTSLVVLDVVLNHVTASTLEAQFNIREQRVLWKARTCVVWVRFILQGYALYTALSVLS